VWASRPREGEGKMPSTQPARRRRYKFLGSREATLQFEVNDQMYFVNFVPDEGRWYVFTPSEEGMIRIPVAMDAAPFENFAVAPEEEKKRIVH
jgi:hypothetical protein